MIEKSVLNTSNLFVHPFQYLFQCKDGAMLSAVSVRMELEAAYGRIKPGIGTFLLPTCIMPQSNELERQRTSLLLRMNRILEGPMVFLGFVWLVILLIELVKGLSPALQMLT